MSEAQQAVRQTTIRFGEDLYSRLAHASAKTGLPINSIVIVACMDWLNRYEWQDRALPRRAVRRGSQQGVEGEEEPTGPDE